MAQSIVVLIALSLLTGEQPRSETAVVLLEKGKSKKEKNEKNAKEAPPERTRIKFRRSGRSPGDEWSGNSMGTKFCWCPPGTFIMGSPFGERNRQVDENQVNVELTKGFWLGKYEVTQAEFKKVMDVNTSFFWSEGPGQNRVADTSTEDFPVERVTWDEAVEFCKQLTLRERPMGLPPQWKYALPTEAQWEYACRAGSVTPTALGMSLSSQQANFRGNSPYNGAVRGPTLDQTCKVGSYLGNPWNFFDMHGNVWEWCADNYEKTLPGGVNPLVTRDFETRVLRGGSWGDGGAACRSASRHQHPPDARFASFGFRVALVPTK